MRLQGMGWAVRPPGLLRADVRDMCEGDVDEGEGQMRKESVHARAGLFGVGGGQMLSARPRICTGRAKGSTGNRGDPRVPVPICLERGADGEPRLMRKLMAQVRVMSPRVGGSLRAQVQLCGVGMSDAARCCRLEVNDRAQSHAVMPRAACVDVWRLAACVRAMGVVVL